MVFIGPPLLSISSYGPRMKGVASGSANTSPRARRFKCWQPAEEDKLAPPTLSEPTMQAARVRTRYEVDTFVESARDRNARIEQQTSVSPVEVSDRSQATGMVCRPPREVVQPENECSRRAIVPAERSGEREERPAGERSASLPPIRMRPCGAFTFAHRHAGAPNWHVSV